MTLLHGTLSDNLYIPVAEKKNKGVIESIDYIVFRKEFPDMFWLVKGIAVDDCHDVDTLLENTAIPITTLVNGTISDRRVPPALKNAFMSILTNRSKYYSIVALDLGGFLSQTVANTVYLAATMVEFTKKVGDMQPYIDQFGLEATVQKAIDYQKAKAISEMIRGQDKPNIERWFLLPSGKAIGSIIETKQPIGDSILGQVVPTTVIPNPTVPDTKADNPALSVGDMTKAGTLAKSQALENGAKEAVMTLTEKTAKAKAEVEAEDSTKKKTRVSSVKREEARQAVYAQKSQEDREALRAAVARGK